MIKKIIIDNFMAHGRTELELGPGVTALTGPNNTGKSAIVEALRCVATNPVPKHYIRHGAKEARVTVELEDGTRVVWIRKARSSGYELWHPGAEEPEEYWKFGRKPPEDILKVLRLDLVELETGGEIDVHVGNQREPVFLLNQPSSNAAAFFAASTESAHLLAMQNLLKRRTQDAKRTERDLETRLHELEEEMDILSPLPDIVLQVETARELEGSANKLQEEIPALEKLLKAQKDLATTLELRQATTNVLSVTLEPPKLSPVSELRSIVHALGEVERRRSVANVTGSVLASLVSPPEVFDTARLGVLCNQLQGVNTRLRKAEDMGNISTKLTEPPEPSDSRQLSEFMDQMIAIRYRHDRLARWDTVLQKVEEPPEVQSDARLVELLSAMHGLMEKKGEIEVSLSKLEKALRTVKDSIVEQVDTLGCCPTCGADLNSEAFLDHGCRHDA